MSDHGAEYDSAALAVITASVAVQDAAAAPLSQCQCLSARRLKIAMAWPDEKSLRALVIFGIAMHASSAQNSKSTFGDHLYDIAPFQARSNRHD